jgi:hypothetical protein
VGFLNIRVSSIVVCISTTRFSVNINGELNGYFPGKRGFRQGDPIFSARCLKRKIWRKGSGRNAKCHDLLKDTHNLGEPLIGTKNVLPTISKRHEDGL